MVSFFGLLVATGLAIILVLWIPIDVALNVETAATRKVRIRLIWLFGVLTINLPGGKPRREQRRREDRKSRRRRPKAEQLLAVVHTKGLLAAAVRWLRRLRTAVTMRELRLRVRFGFDDPADTGLFFAAIAPVMWLLRASGLDRFSAEADFEEETLSIDGNVDVRIYPAPIIGASAMFLLSPATLRAAKAAFWSR